MKLFLLLPVYIILWISCTNDRLREESSNPGEENQLLVRFTVITPASDVYAYPVRTGFLSDAADETTIGNVQLLVFEGGNFLYRVTASSIAGNGERTTFTARLRPSASAVKLMVIANAAEAVIDNNPSAGNTEEEVKNSLISPFDATGISRPLPMYGELTLSEGLVAGTLNQIGTIKMLRAIARIDIRSPEATNFRMSSIQTYRASDSIQLIPEESTVPVTAPSIPPGATSTIVTTPVPASSTASISQLYLPEAPAPPAGRQTQDACCIILGGYYGDDTIPTYYRVDFNASGQNGTFGQVLRNFRYLFNIKKVSSSGWSTPDEAANNPSSQIEVETMTWDENTTDMYFDGPHHFGVSSREAVVDYRADSTVQINVSTDLTDYTLQWTDDLDQPSGSPASSLENSEFKVEILDKGTVVRVTALQANTSEDTERTGKFILAAGRWQIPMTIRQRVKPVSTKRINLLSFNTGLGNLGSYPLLNGYSGETRGLGLRGILTNANNFGLSGTVACGGYNLLISNVSVNNLTEDLFATADVIYLNYISTANFSVTDSKNLNNWLKVKNRVLIVSLDGNGINGNVLTQLLGGTQNLVWPSSTQPFPVAGKAAGNYFTDAGPFTQPPYTPVSATFAYRCYDGSHGELKPAGSAGVTPILYAPDKTNIVLGFDLQNRIVYLGDIDIFSASSGGTANTYIQNTTGNINNDASKLIANLFAKIAEIVLAD